MLLEGMQLGRYRLGQLLGTGGMGEVYLGEDTHIRRQVAIKVTRAEATSYPNSETARETTRLFQREVRAIAMLDHPYILPLFDYGEQDMEATVLTYMVMPYRREGSLSTWLRQRGERGSAQVLTPQEIAHFIQQAAVALAYAHAHQIVHQDVKPSNFLLRDNELSPDLPDLLLADFGIAKFTSASASMSQSSRGTPTYMAPEQWSGHPVAASDQYALAIMTYQLLTGSLPFQGRQEQVMYQHFNAQPQPPSARNPRISKDVDSVILRVLSKKPEERFPSISAFSTALKQAMIVLVCSGVFYFKNFTTTVNSGTTDPYTSSFGSLIMNDPLSDNSRGYSWNEGDISNGGSCQFFNGGYKVVATAQEGYHWCISNISASDFAYQVQVTILQGNSAGLIFRADNNSDFYYFQIGTDQSYEFDAIQSGSPNTLIGSTLLNGNPNVTINGQGQSNTIAVVANGSTIDLYVNGQQVDSVTDSTFSQGYIGVAASTSTEAVFSNALVWTA